MTPKTPQSELISAMRLPLLYCIILIHTYYNREVAPHPSDVSNYIHYFMTEVLSGHALYAAVICYFIFSSYYIYSKIPEQGWSQDFYYKTLAKRIPTLLIPFLLWGLLYVAAVWAKNGAFELVGLPFDERHKILSRSIESLIWGTANAPLWYLRDLMCMCLISPLFYYFFLYTRAWGLLVLSLFYMSGIQLGVLGFSPMAIASFGLGAYLGMYKLDIPTICWRLRYVALSITLVVPVVATLDLCPPTVEWGLMSIYYLFGGSITIVNGFNWLVSKYAKVKDFFIALAPATFFIYSCNEIYILNWVKGAFARLPFSDVLFVRILSYFCIPLVTIAVCYALYRLCLRFVPRATSVLSGGRAS